MRPDVPLVAFIGRLDPQKGADILLEVCLHVCLHACSCMVVLACSFVHAGMVPVGHKSIIKLPFVLIVCIKIWPAV